MQSFHSGASFYILGNIMILGILTYQERLLTDLAKNSWSLENDSSFKRHSRSITQGLPYQCFVLSFLLCIGSIKEQISKIQEA